MSAMNRSAIAPSKNALPPQELLDDLCSRFVLNVPKEDQQSFERILFLVEYAHWFYEDNSVEKNPSLKSLTLKEFTSLLFNNCDVLKPYVAHIDDIFKDFTSYKVRVPVTGAIILDETYERYVFVPETDFPDLKYSLRRNHHLPRWLGRREYLNFKSFMIVRFHECLLVKGWKGTSWSFPRGKKNKDEEDHSCAIREVLEETGFDVSKLLNKDECIEMIFGQQRVRLYIVAGVKEGTLFAPLTKKEISEIAWQVIDELQHSNADVISRGSTGLKLYMVAPFLASLKSWISVHPPPVAPRPDRPKKGVTVWKARTVQGEARQLIASRLKLWPMFTLLLLVGASETSDLILLRFYKQWTPPSLIEQKHQISGFVHKLDRQLFVIPSSFSSVSMLGREYLRIGPPDEFRSFGSCYDPNR